MTTAPHNYDHERALWNDFAESAWKNLPDTEPVFRWTQYADHPADPGPGLLGDPGSVLEVGSGTGRSLAYLAARGVKAVGVDLSPVAVEQSRARYRHLGAEFVCADVLTHLAEDPRTHDAVYSVFGAVWFTAPGRLFPLVAARLNPGGVFAFSQPPAIPGTSGPQGMYKGGFAGPAMYTYRYSYSPRAWARHLTAAGFTDVTVTVLDAPSEGHIGTLIGRAKTPYENRP